MEHFVRCELCLLVTMMSTTIKRERFFRRWRFRLTKPLKRLRSLCFSAATLEFCWLEKSKSSYNWTDLFMVSPSCSNHSCRKEKIGATSESFLSHSSSSLTIIVAHYYYCYISCNTTIVWFFLFSIWHLRSSLVSICLSNLLLTSGDLALVAGDVCKVNDENDWKLCTAWY